MTSNHMHKVEYRQGLPSVEAVEAHWKRGGWWQHKREHRPVLMRLWVSRVNENVEDRTPHIWSPDLPSRDRNLDPLVVPDWRGEPNRYTRAKLQEEDPAEWLWRPCTDPYTEDGDPMPWPSPPIDENPTPPESGETLIMPWRITLELGPGKVIEPREVAPGSFCAGPWDVGAETVVRTAWVRVHRHCGVLAYLTEERGNMHPNRTTGGDTPREAVTLLARGVAHFGEPCAMGRFRSLTVEPTGPAEVEPIR